MHESLDPRCYYHDRVHNGWERFIEENHANALGRLLHITDPQIRKIDPHLAEKARLGIFAEHGPEHHDWVLHTGRHLLDLAHASPIDYLIFFAAASHHDLGNIKGRAWHSAGSIGHFFTTFPDADPNDPMVRAVLAAIYFHDEQPGQHIHSYASLPQTANIQYPLPMWALIIADKAHMSRSRSPPGLLSNSVGVEPRIVLKEDPYCSVTFYIEDTTVSMTPDASMLNIDSIFSLSLLHPNEKIAALLGRYADPEKRERLLLPYEYWEKAPLQMYCTFEQRLYLERYAMLLSCAFAMFRTLHVVQRSIRSAADPSTVIKIDYHRGDWHIDLQNARKKGHLLHPDIFPYPPQPYSNLVRGPEYFAGAAINNLDNFEKTIAMYAH